MLVDNKESNWILDWGNTSNKKIARVGNLGSLIWIA